MLRLAKSLQLFGGSPEDAVAQSFLAPPNGFTVSAPTRHCLENYHGPGTVFQGQLNLQLAKPIRGPCRLRVIFSCLHTMPSDHSQTPTQPLSARSSSTEERKSSDSTSQKFHHPLHQFSLFEIDHVFVEDEPLHVKRHTFMFNIKFPRVNFPASMTDGDRSVMYAVQGELTFQTTPDLAETQATILSPPIHLKYLPLVPTCIPHYPVIEMAQVMDPYTNKPLFKASLESPQRGVCPGEELPLTLTITNLSEIELYNIHLSLVRVISYPTASNPSSPSSATAPSAASPGAGGPVALDTEPTTVHTVTIPVTKTPNKNSNWMEPIQFKIPSNLGLIPTTNKVISSLYKVDYYLSVSMPIASRGSGLASWFTPTVKNPPPVDISLIRSATGNAAGAGATGSDSEPLTSSLNAGQRKNSVDRLLKVNLHMDRITTLNSTMKWPTLIQLPLIPIIIGTVPYSVTERQLRWPIPNYLDVTDRPRFIRDRFEEEMMQHLKSLETLIVNDGDDEQDIKDIIEAATRKSGSSSESDEEEQRVRTRIPERFRDVNSSSAHYRRKDSQSHGSTSGLGTPPPSPPTATNAGVIEGAIHQRPGGQTLPRAGPRRSLSPKAGGLSKELLLEMHHSKIQQSLHQASLQDI